MSRGSIPTLNDGPVVANQFTHTESIDGVVLTTRTEDTVWLHTEHADCDVCLMVDQHDPETGWGRHALMRLTAEQARELADALTRASKGER